MSHTTHTAIIVTGPQPDILLAWDAAHDGDVTVTPIRPSPYNNVATFLVCPHGSKAGWPQALAADKEREAFIEWLRRQRYDDGSSVFEWVEVRYGELSEGEYGTEIVSDEWDTLHYCDRCGCTTSTPQARTKERDR